jgi:hypothetical protein
LSGGIEDVIEQVAAIGVLEGEDLRGDFDQVGIEFTFVPFGEGIGQLWVVEAEPGRKEMVGLGNELHVAVLDAVMDHLNEVARAAFADPVAAGNAIVDLRGDGLENGADVGPRFRRATGHEGRTVPRAFLAAGDAGADEENSFFLQLLVPAHRVRIMGIAAVDDDVALFEQRHETVDELVDRLARLDQEHDAARPFR